MMKLKKIKKNSVIDFFSADDTTSMSLPIIAGRISAGFPSPADDYIDLKLDLNKELIKNPNATFYGRVKGSSMHGAGIDDGDVLVIDKSLEPRDGTIAICFIDGEFTVKRIKKKKGFFYLMPENDLYEPIKVTEQNEFLVWGIVTYIIKKI